jgi:hypothetical protein
MRMSVALASLSMALAAPAAGAPAPARAPAPAAVPTPVPPADANLFVYRDHAEPLLFALTVKIDGRKVATLSQKQFTAVHLPPGRHSVKVSWPFLTRQPSVEAQVTIPDDGSPLYLEVSGASRWLPGEKIVSAIRAWRPDLGAARLSACCHYKPAQ